MPNLLPTDGPEPRLDPAKLPAGDGGCTKMGAKRGLCADDGGSDIHWTV
jgi:hypothetical protein